MMVDLVSRVGGHMALTARDMTVSKVVLAILPTATLCYINK